ncbi:transcriptional regulator (tetR-family) [Oceanobacillus iheyensis HTE831]|uniref:Transcriptional regulator (TetR-family) n=1 Tax=Oceanobacillus iheyensis (strain DSM 14371 / CIP 107618 / JCM 11309 / KCTC 3954 / HTE831) TaxID=221109 RepID=Q8ELN7_OCEIH|nr:TetR/AcrR family transcriptional regulator [Oceanobacillus iheyensis]BAC15140.1 transcriptional regulator (tetR-family) [Oceanobacillus iheyensis HTE831]
MNENYVDKRIQRSKIAIRESFLSILEEKHFEEISISEICRVANYNRGTFYSHYDSKQILLEEVIHDTLHDMVEEIKKPYIEIEIVDMKSIPIEDISLFYYLKENAALYKLLLSDHIRVDFRFQLAKAIEDLFIQEYEYEILSDSNENINIKWFYIYRAHGIAGFIIRWIEDDFPHSPSYMAKQIVELMVSSTAIFHQKK